MDRWHYLIVLGASLLLTLPLEFVLGARVYRSPKRLLLAMAPMLVLFIAWDAVGIRRGHWHYNEQFISGLHIGWFPVEEILFFLVIPICGLLTYEAVGNVLALFRNPGRLTYTWHDGLVRVDATGDERA